MSATEAIATTTHTWQWQGFPIRYQRAGSTGPAVVLVHGFGASSDHWRKNLPVLGEQCRVFAIDLIGFGLSAKPAPGNPISYRFETWGQQILDFCHEVVGESAFLIGNSIGCVAAAQAAVMQPEQVRGIAMLDCSLRMLHDRKRLTLPWYRRMSAPLLQGILSNRAIGHLFFSQIANRRTVRNVLRQAYGRKEEVTDELVDLLLKPAAEPGAADVFLAFVRYSQGPLVEDLLPQLTCPVLMLWGAEDPWEPIALGRALAEYPAVEDFIPLEGIGHCPQDEDPERVNALLSLWISRHT